MIDLRTPIGWLFVLVGVSLSTYGLTSDPAVYDASLGLNVNLWWGLVMAVFGAAMLAAAMRSRSTSEPTDSTTAGETSSDSDSRPL